MNYSFPPLFAFFFLLKASFAQSADLQGTLKDRYGNQAPIADAEVSLNKTGIKTRTDGQGGFHLSEAPTRIGKAAYFDAADLRWVPEKGLIFRVMAPGEVSVRLLELSGRTGTRFAKARLGKGTWSFSPAKIPNGIYYLEIRSSDLRAGIRIANLGGRDESTTPGFHLQGNPESPILAKSAAAEDSLWINKPGYFESHVPLSSMMQTGMQLTLADTTSDLALLRALFPSQSSLQPPFDPSLFRYSMAVRESASVLSFTAIAAPASPFISVANGSAKIVGSSGIPTNPVPLSMGNNPFVVTSISQDSSAKFDYYIDINRAVDSSADLSGLSVNSGTLSPVFAPGILVYNVSLPKSTTSLSLTPTAQPMAAIRIKGNSITSGQASPPVTIRSGIDTIPVEVTSPNGRFQSTYLVITDRPVDTAPAPPALSSLAIKPAGGFTPTFDPATTQYNAWFPAGPGSIALSAVASLPTQVVTLPGRTPVAGRDSTQLTPGDSGTFTYKVAVASADGSNPKTYSIVIHKGASSIATLARIDFSPNWVSFSPSFSPSKSTLWYDVTMASTDSIVKITPVATDPMETVYYYNAAIPAGTAISAYVMSGYGSTTVMFQTVAGDGVTKGSYTLHITRTEPVPPGSVVGPTIGLKDTAYKYTLTPSAGCPSTSSTSYSLDFGDGSAIIKGKFSDITKTSVTHTYGLAGTYQIRMKDTCDRKVSDWSAPAPIQIIDGAASGAFREISGPRMASETWHKDTLYLITGSALFEKSTTLTIEPGTRISFIDTSYYLNITGNLSAVGTAADSIYFDRANLRVRWGVQGDLTYNPDGSYLKGPRLEYCSMPNGYIYIDRTDTEGKWGVYLKNSIVHHITGEEFKYANGTYIDHCRIGNLDGLKLMNSWIRDSYIESGTVTADIGTPLRMNRCKMPLLTFNYYDFTTSDITGNTFQRIFIKAGTPGTLRGNNILPGPSIPGGPVAVNASTGLWDMQQNYWGDSTTTEMNAKGINQNISVIHDYFDDVGLGKMDYSNWKTAPITDAGPDW